MSNVHDLKNFKYCKNKEQKKRRLLKTLDNARKVLQNDTEHSEIWDLLKVVDNYRTDAINAIEYYGKMAKKREVK